MTKKHLISTALAGLAANKPRSALTILGIVIGIASIMLIASTGNSAEKLIVNELGGLGAESIVVRPGREPSGPTEFAEALLSDSLKERELNAISSKTNVPYAVDVAPEIFIPGGVAYEGETFSATILGFSARFMEEAFKLRIKEGTVFDENDIKTRAQVAIIGDRVREELFGSENPIGKYIQMKDRKFRVIGVYEPRGRVVFFDIDELVLVPYTTAQTYLSGVKYYNQIIVRAASPEVVDRVVLDIEQTLRKLHNIDNPEKDDFHVQTQQGLVRQVTSILNIFTIFLSLVVAVALVVGGIGIMNIMLVSVSERTREIGLRKALGATRRDILLQFLAEAVFLTGAGGIVGIFLGSALSLATSFIISRYLGGAPTFAFPASASILGLASAVLVGIIFGIYPAKKAAEKSPIEALRYE